MTRYLTLLPFALLLIVLPFPGTVALRLLLLATCFGIALWQWWRVPAARSPIPCKPVLGAWILVCLASLTYAFDPAYTLGELKNEVGYTMMAFFAFFVASHRRSNAVWLLRACGLGIVVIGSWAVFAWLGNKLVWNEAAGHGGSGVFATLIVTVLPGMVWLSCTESAPAWRRAALAVTSLALLLAFASMQRAVWPVLALEAILAMAMAMRAGLVRLGRRQLLTIVGLVIAGSLAGLLAIQQIRYGASPDESVQLNTDVRIAYWPKVLARVIEHPLAGTGYGRGVIHQAYPDLTPAETPALWHAHNVLLNYGLEMGLPGILVLASLFAGFALRFWCASVGPTAVAGIAGLTLVAGVLLRNQFNDFFVRDMSMMFWALTGLLVRQTMTANRGIE